MILRNIIGIRDYCICNVLYSISFLVSLGYISIVSKNVLAETTIIL